MLHHGLALAGHLLPETLPHAHTDARHLPGSDGRRFLESPLLGVLHGPLQATDMMFPRPPRSSDAIGRMENLQGVKTSCKVFRGTRPSPFSVNTGSGIPRRIAH